MKQTKSGQGVIEYLILVAIIAVASLGIVKILGGTVTAKLAQITHTLQGEHTKAAEAKPPKVEKKHWQPRDMDDFYEASD